MKIFIARNNEKHGPYSLDDIQEYVVSGHLHGEDLAWIEGAPSWVLLSQVPGVRLPQNKVPPPPPQIAPINKQLPPSKKPLTTSKKVMLVAFSVLVVMSVMSSLMENFQKAKTEAQNRATTLDKQSKERVAAQKRAAAIAANPKLVAAQREKVRRAKEEEARAVEQKENERKAKAKKEERLAEERSNNKQKAVKAFAGLLNKEGNGQLFASYETSGNDLVLKAADDWHIQPYQYRLQRAQAFHLIWAKSCGLDDPRDAGFSITDIMGNEVGGWNIISGIWVKE